MTISNLSPQIFTNQMVTQLPAIDFFEYAKTLLPLVYQNAPNYMAAIKTISTNKQYIYDIIRSLVNSYNINDAGSGADSAIPTGIYLQMAASVFNTPYATGSTDEQILNAIQNTVLFVNSRGYPSDFQKYFLLNNLEGYITNYNIEEDGNATIVFNVPIISSPLNPPNPFDVFTTDMLKLKGAGIEVIIIAANVPYFQYGSLPTDSPPYQVASGNAGFGVLTNDGHAINGGFFISL